MAAAYANASWDLGTARRGQDYRVQRSNVQLAGDTQNWVNAVVASSNRAAAENTAATAAGSANAVAGIRAQADVISQGLESDAFLKGAGLNAVTSAYGAKTQADALIKQARISRGSEAMQGLRLAGGLGLTALGLFTL